MALPNNLLPSFHPVKNNGIDPLKVAPASNIKIWWLCDLGHEWEASPNGRTVRGTGCPVCANKRIQAGFNDLGTIRPDVAQEWHPILNGALKPSEIAAATHRKVWWLGPCGHEWDAAVSDRTRKRNSRCPFCTGQKVLKGYNDLGSLYPHLATEWHPTKNYPLTPYDVTKTSGKKVWWIGACGHEWQCAVSARSQRSSGCNVCNRKNAGIIKTIPKVGSSIADLYPNLVLEWDYETNGSNKPESVSNGSDKVIHWICVKKHKWSTRAYQRTGKQITGCPRCWSARYKSFNEIEVSNFIKSLGVNIKTSDREALSGREIDIYIPSFNIGIEFNGIYWHTEDMGKHKTYHYDKWKIARDRNIQLIQIWEDDWRDRRDIVMRMLAHKLNKADGLALLYPHLAPSVDKVFARATTVIELTSREARIFLDQNHIQGFASGGRYVGLKDAKGVTRAVMVLKKQSNSRLVLTRYATYGVVVGGFTKLISHIKRSYSIQEIVTFADHMVSNGDLYEKHGFVNDGEIPPDYSYLVNKRRTHKFGYRIGKFKSHPGLKWEEGLTERELADLNGLKRIWDAGKTRYILNA